ncbi:stage III sporulation protein AH [Pelagirhabdus alkalitolerans]|uniref:Stage III sporulation protein AH n=1 Tax=Pelagirhabdus alkalitolerans TaxID=1612202 RepID=A0A1G6I157_9BACI|nr:SpoIIIAH-like family protein [Pelagirhabdus alkalitolerans]SDC00128.1 stage III sporulation protein AH [Pelagirhabdus alkalitolerans]
MLKKQTVWLLTLLSLMIVLSVFYINSPTEDDFTMIFQSEEDSIPFNDDKVIMDDESPIFETSAISDVVDETNVEMEDVEIEDDLFTFIRLELNQSRSQLMEQLETVMASAETTTKEKNDAYEQMREIDQLSTKELIAEETLKDLYDYEDVLVRTMDDVVVVTVRADELQDQEANQIMRHIYDEFGEKSVEVKFQ